MPTEETTPGQTIVREVDRKTQARLRSLELSAEKAKYKAAISKSRQEARDAAAQVRFLAKTELEKMRVAMTAREAASKHIAVFGPLYLLLLVGTFIASVSYIPESQISVVSALLTLLVTSIAANLRSIVAGEGNGHSEEETKPDAKASSNNSKPKTK